LRPSTAYVIQRWREGCTDSMQLWRELRALGYGHFARTVSRFLTRRRRASEAGWPPRRRPHPIPVRRGRRPAPSRAPGCALAAKRSQDAQMDVDHLPQGDAASAQA